MTVLMGLPNFHPFHRHDVRTTGLIFSCKNPLDVCSTCRINIGDTRDEAIGVSETRTRVLQDTDEKVSRGISGPELHPWLPEFVEITNSHRLDSYEWIFLFFFNLYVRCTLTVLIFLTQKIFGNQFTLVITFIPCKSTELNLLLFFFTISEFDI